MVGAALGFTALAAPGDLRRRLESIVGNADASPDQITEACGLLESIGGIAHARGLAEEHLERAMKALDWVSILARLCRT
jgi:geranylgeranyl pyrophosphate synthase